MNYKNYTIEPDNTGYAPKNMVFGIFKEEEYIGSGETIDECKKLIDENILENTELQQSCITAVICGACGAENSIKWEKKEISIDDKHGSYKDLTFNFCEECGNVTDVDFS